MAYLNNELNNKKILVTGANGFIGSCLIKKLVIAGAKVTAIVRDDSSKIDHLKEKIKIIKTDLSNSRNLTIKDMDVIFHLAALTDLKKCLEKPLEAYNANVLGTINLLGNCQNIKKFVYVSTLGVYGEQRHFPVDENALPMPIEPYAASKLAGEYFVHSFCVSKNIPFSIARLFNVYGPGQKEDFIIPNIIKKAIKHEEITLKNLDSTRDFIYIDDAVRALILVSMVSENEIYNIGSGKETSIKDLIKIIEKLIKVQMRIKIALKNKVANVQRSVADIKKLKEMFGWAPETNLETGIEKVIEYYKNDLRRDIK